MSGRRVARAMLAVVCAGGVWTPRASAQPDGQQDPPTQSAATTIDTLVEALGAPSAAARAGAQQRLIERLDLEDIETLLARRDLSPEQRRRLDAAAYEKLFNDPAGLGVEFGVSDTSGTTIERTTNPDFFPAATILRSGDVIISIDGVAMDSRERVRVEILSHAPGDVMETVVRRDGELVTLALPLGRFRDLNGATLVDEPTRAAAYARRRERSPLFRRESIGAQLDAQAWIDAAYDTSVSTGRDSAGADGRVRVVGVAVGGTSVRTHSPGAWDGGSLWTIPRPRLSGEGNTTIATQDMRDARVIELRRQLNALLVRNNHERRSLDRGDLSPEELRGVRSRIAAREKLIEELTAESDALMTPTPTQPDRDP